MTELNDLFSVADDDESVVLRELGIRAGKLWRCSCGYVNPNALPQCEDCGKSRAEKARARILPLANGDRVTVLAMDDVQIGMVRDEATHPSIHITVEESLTYLRVSLNGVQIHPREVQT